MQKLMERGLFGAGLTRVDSAVLVERYNRCLERVGVLPTLLSSFDIDGMGWSPQIAQEKDDEHYLSHGSTHSIIILTPDQRGKPIYRPYHSFDAAILEKIFRNAGRQIADITTRTAMWFDVDKGITNAQTPSDLLMVDSVTIHPHTVSGVMKAARDQRELVREFVTSESAWADSALRTKIIESVKAHGDLRMRSIVINDISFTDLRSYHTAAFGGTFVLRDLKNDGYMLVLEDEQNVEMGEQIRWHYRLADPAVVARLRKEEWLTVDLDWYADHLCVLDELKEYLLVEALSREAENEVDYSNLTTAQMGRYSVALEGFLSGAYGEVERLYAHLTGKKRRRPQISPKLWPYLMRPCTSLPEETQEVLWHLIARTVPVDIRRLYHYDKEYFFGIFNGWPEKKKDWAVRCLTDGVACKSE